MSIITQFIKSIESNLLRLCISSIPSLLEPYLTKINLQTVYIHILKVCTQEHTQTALLAGNLIRIPKGKTLERHQPLPRTVVLFMDDSSEINAILETKSKTKNQTKDPLTPKFKGHYKIGKSCFRIDTPNPLEYASMVSYFDSEPFRQIFIRENNFIIQYVKGLNYHNRSYGFTYKSKKNQNKGVQYSPKALFDLHTLIFEKPNLVLSPEQLSLFILDLLYGIKEFHDKNLIIQDVKPRNILVYEGNNDLYRLKFTDYGYSKVQNTPGDVISSQIFESPETLHLYSEPHNGFYNIVNITNHHKYFNSHENYVSVGSLYYTDSLIDNQIKNQSFSNQHRFLYSKTHKANDMWSLGIIILGLLTRTIQYTKQSVELIKHSNPLIRGLLAPERDKRFTIEEAILCFMNEHDLCFRTKPSALSIQLNNQPQQNAIVNSLESALQSNPTIRMHDNQVLDVEVEQLIGKNQIYLQQVNLTQCKNRLNLLLKKLNQLDLNQNLLTAIEEIEYFIKDCDSYIKELTALEDKAKLKDLMNSITLFFVKIYSFCRQMMTPDIAKVEFKILYNYVKAYSDLNLQDSAYSKMIECNDNSLPSNQEEEAALPQTRLILL